MELLRKELTFLLVLIVLLFLLLVLLLLVFLLVLFLLLLLVLLVSLLPLDDKRCIYIAKIYYMYANLRVSYEIKHILLYKISKLPILLYSIYKIEPPSSSVSC